MEKLVELTGSRLVCPFNKNNSGMSFSLVDYRNNFFTSNNRKKIIEFYNSFENRNQLIQWMRDRPRGNCAIREIEGDNDIILVIPTIDSEGEFARNCSQNIFKGLHIIFVESYYNNFYFNYAHNCNVGIRKAMEYNPKWIIVSNDDMDKVDNVEILKEALNSLDNSYYDVVFPSSSDYHTIPFYISKKRITYQIYKLITEKQTKIFYDKFDVNFFNSRFTLKSKFIFKKVKGTDFINITAFSILSSNYIKTLGDHIFDETYINEREDVDLSYRFVLTDARFAFISYSIKALRGSTLGNNFSRGLRSVAGRIYFNFKYERLFIKMLQR